VWPFSGEEEHSQFGGGSSNLAIEEFNMSSEIRNQVPPAPSISGNMDDESELNDDIDDDIDEELGLMGSGALNRREQVTTGVLVTFMSFGFKFGPPENLHKVYNLRRYCPNLLFITTNGENVSHRFATFSQHPSTSTFTDASSMKCILTQICVVCRIRLRGRARLG
jgi:hypothetical protein